MASKESNECFLTEQQREMMKIASMNVENSAPVLSRTLSSSPKGPGLASSPKSNTYLSDHHAKGGGKAPAVRHVRRTHSGKPVKVKKDGGGGKGTWGKLLDTDGDVHLDRNDPNYDSEEEPYKLVEATVTDLLDDYKKVVASIIEEYFNNGEVEVATSDLRELGSE